MGRGVGTPKGHEGTPDTPKELGFMQRVRSNALGVLLAMGAGGLIGCGPAEGPNCANGQCPPKPDAGMEYKDGAPLEPDAKSVDKIAPPAPKIKTNDGKPWDPGKGDIEIEGGCDISDTTKIQVMDLGSSTAMTQWTDVKVTFDKTKGTWKWDTKVKESNIHRFKFRAVDEAGNESKPSDEFYVEWAD